MSTAVPFPSWDIPDFVLTGTGVSNRMDIHNLLRVVTIRPSSHLNLFVAENAPGLPIAPQKRKIHEEGSTKTNLITWCFYDSLVQVDPKHPFDSSNQGYGDAFGVSACLGFWISKMRFRSFDSFQFHLTTTILKLLPMMALMERPEGTHCSLFWLKKCHFII
jgi:hypothetical protein